MDGSLCGVRCRAISKGRIGWNFGKTPNGLWTSSSSSLWSNMTKYYQIGPNLWPTFMDLEYSGSWIGNTFCQHLESWLKAGKYWYQTWWWTTGRNSDSVGSFVLKHLCVNLWNFGDSYAVARFLVKVLFNLSVRSCSGVVMQLAAAVIEVERKGVCGAATVQVGLVHLVLEGAAALESINIFPRSVPCPLVLGINVFFISFFYSSAASPCRWIWFSEALGSKRT